MTVPGRALPRLSVDGICEHCDRGLHRLCRHPDCECLAGSGPRHHINRPKAANTSTPPQQQGAPMTVTPPGPITPIRAKAPAGPKPEPKISLRKVDALPDKPSTKRLADKVLDHLRDAELDAGEWYELITYPSGRGHGAGSAATRLSNDHRLKPYEFASRGSIVYVRSRAE